MPPLRVAFCWFAVLIGRCYGKTHYVRPALDPPFGPLQPAGSFAIGRAGFRFPFFSEFGFFTLGSHARRDGFPFDLYLGPPLV